MRSDPRPPSSARATLWQPREPAFWLYVIVVAATGFITVARQGVYREVSPSGWTLAWLLVIVYALPILAIAFTLDLFRREPISVLLGAIVWGAVAAATLASIANGGWSLALARVGGPGFASRWAAALTAPWVEESLKLSGVVLIYLIIRRGMGDLLDGFLFAAMCGLGFAVVEEIFYFMAVFGGKPGDVWQGFFIRVVANGLYGHLLYTGLGGIGIAYLVTRRDSRSRARRVLVAGCLTLLGVGGHLLWNSPWTDLFPRQPWTGGEWIVLPLAVAVKAVPFAVFVALTTILARRREKGWLDEASSRIDGRAITPDELQLLRSRGARRRAVREMRMRAGPRAARLLRRLQREQVDLAMSLARAGESDDPSLASRMGYCRSLRDALDAMPAAASAAG